MAKDEFGLESRAEGKNFVLGPRMQGMELNGDKCVIWPGAKRNGYGVKKMGSTTVAAHTYVWEKSTGRKLPKGWQLDHKCRNRACVNPKHLEPLPPGKNKERAWAFKKSDWQIAKGERFDRGDAVGVGAGATAGAALMPWYSPKPRNGRKAEINRLVDENLKGAKAGDTVETSIKPERFMRIAERKGNRLQNERYTARSAMAAMDPSSEYSQKAQGKKYVATVFQDKDGTNYVRQQDGRHFGQVKSMLGQDVPAKLHVVEGRPTESTGIKALERVIRSHSQRKSGASQVGLPRDEIERRAKGYRSDRVNSFLQEKLSHREGTDKVDKPFKAIKNVRAKQAAFLAGGTGAGYVISRKTKDRQARGRARMDAARTRAAAQIVPKEQVGKAERRNYGPEAAGAVAGGAAAASVTPFRMRTSASAKEFAEKYKDLPEGEQVVRSRDLQRIASPGYRGKHKNKILNMASQKTNQDYTMRMADSIRQGKLDPEKGKVVIYDDSARNVGGAHRIHARAFAGQPDQKVDVVRVAGHNSETRPGVVAALDRIKRSKLLGSNSQFTRYTPKDAKDFDEKLKRVDVEATDKARAGATHETSGKIAPGWTKKQLRAHHGKQAAIIGGGAVAGGLLVNAARKRD